MNIRTIDLALVSAVIAAVALLIHQTKQIL